MTLSLALLAHKSKNTGWGKLLIAEMDCMNTSCSAIAQTRLHFLHRTMACTVLTSQITGRMTPTMRCLQGSPTGLHFEPNIVVGLAIAAQCALVAFILLHTQCSLWARFNAHVPNPKTQMRCTPLPGTI